MDSIYLLFENVMLYEQVENKQAWHHLFVVYPSEGKSSDIISYPVFNPFVKATSMQELLEFQFRPVQSFPLTHR